ncbi:hypothetical protein [Desertimonas flava]|uniref:hypothetical protein n=1 Tax=Desertimonas flava TaxID=2064846 RepID=UPI0013C42359|nr:hypothetical protein [Desertimonas flava]
MRRDDGSMVDLTPTQLVATRIDLDAERAVVGMADGRWLFSHVCDRGDRGILRAAPALQVAGGGHRIVHVVPLTITPSILCDDCGTHGFVTRAEWVPA